MRIDSKRRGAAAWLCGLSLVAMVAGCGGGGSSTPSLASSGELLFVSKRDVAGVAGGEKLFSANLDGSNVHYIPTHRAGVPSSPKWFPGRREIVYRSVVNPLRGAMGTLRQVKRDGTGDREAVSPQVFDASVSPNGQRLAYSALVGSVENLFVSDANGANRIQLGPGREPSWSSNGQRILFWSPGPQNNDFSIWVMNADGTNRARLRNFDDFVFSPQYSPDGQRIVFESINKTDSASNLFVMNADGSNLKQLTKNNQPLNTNPRWTPDGKRIAFLIYNDSLESWIEIMNADGSHSTPLLEEQIDTFDLR